MRKNDTPYYLAILDKARVRREMVLAMYLANGGQLRPIAEQLGVTRARVQQILKRAGYVGKRMQPKPEQLQPVGEPSNDPQN